MKWFSNPLVLRLLALLPVLVLLGYLAVRRRQRALAQIGSVPAVKALTSARPGRRFLRGMLLFAGIAALVVGSAGPQWGRDQSADSAAVSGRDLVIVLDLSRSMLAEQPSRQERALRALRDLADTLETHGGHRVALVIFAARPKLAFPLTSDYDHLRAVLSTLDADSLPAEMRPRPDEGSISGTRIGAGLRLAVETHELRFQGAQDILLICDGDDPAQDKEWRQGIAAATAKKIPVHVVGLGDPKTASSIPFGNGFLRHDNIVVTSRLHEKPLQEIAEATGGVYLSAQTNALPLGHLFRTVIEPRGERTASEIESTADLPILQARYRWFFSAALTLLALTMLLTERRWLPSSRFASAALWAVPLAFLLVSADTPQDNSVPRSPADGLVRQANAAFTNEDYAVALHYYEQAEERIADPGLVAFNKAAALYQLERYREAELHYARCLDDKEVPLSRKARALYDLGNCLVKQAQPDDAATLERGLSCYRDSLSISQGDTELRENARHNLEITTLLWLRARSASKRPPQNPDRPDEPRSDTERPDPKENGRFNKAGAGDPGEKGTERVGTEPDEPGGKKPAAAGKLLNLPDQEDLVPLPPEETSAFLNRAVRRIESERRDYRRTAVPPSEKVRDW